VRAQRRRSRHAERERDVKALGRVGRELGFEPFTRSRRFGDHQEPARFFVDAMDDAGAEGPRVVVLVRRRSPEAFAREQAVHERARTVPARGMHDEPGGLVDDEQRVVLVHHLESDARIRHGVTRFGGQRFDLEHGSRADQVTRAARGAVDEDVSRFDPALELGARHARHEQHERLVEPLAGARFDDEAELAYQILLFTCPFERIRMSTRARS
jgi:hypothetical protein